MRIAQLAHHTQMNKRRAGMSDSRWCVVARVQVLPDGHVVIIHVDETERKPIPAGTESDGPRDAALAAFAGTLAALPVLPGTQR